MSAAIAVPSDSASATTACWPTTTPPSRRNSSSFNTLLADLVIFHNALDIMDVVRSLVAEGWTITAGQLGALSPYLRAHISRFGSYATDELGHRPEAFDPVLKEVDFTTLDLAA